MKLSPKIITHLKDTNTIKWEKRGREIIFDETSIQQFEKTFNRDDYITTIEGNSKLSDIGVTTICLNNRSGEIHPLGYKVSVNTLIEEKKLQTISFGDTTFVSKQSFSKTLKWLKREYKKLYPPLTQSDIEKLKQQLEEKKKKQHPYQKRIPKFVKK